MTQYHQAPHTLDPTKELPDADELAPSAGHDEEMGEKVREYQEEFKAGVEEADAQARERAESDAPEPPYPAGHDAGVPPEEQEGEPQPSEGGASQPPDGTVNDVLDWVGDDPARAQQALEAERAGQNRSTLVAELEARAG